MTRSTLRTIILVTGLITALVHLVLLNIVMGTIDPLFTLNGLGYLDCWRLFITCRSCRNGDVLLGVRVTAVTILAWVMGGRTPPWVCDQAGRTDPNRRALPAPARQGVRSGSSPSAAGFAPRRYSFARYLSAKATVDDRSLNAHVWDTLRGALDVRRQDAGLKLVELGSGIGTMVERLLAAARRFHLRGIEAQLA
jgi:hypothetical protein